MNIVVENANIREDEVSDTMSTTLYMYINVSPICCLVEYIIDKKGRRIEKRTDMFNVRRMGRCMPFTFIARSKYNFKDKDNLRYYMGKK